MGRAAELPTGQAVVKALTVGGFRVEAVDEISGGRSNFIYDTRTIQIERKYLADPKKAARIIYHEFMHVLQQMAFSVVKGNPSDRMTIVEGLYKAKPVSGTEFNNWEALAVEATREASKAKGWPELSELTKDQLGELASQSTDTFASSGTTTLLFGP